ncbi:MAG: hypothetical protein QNK36_04925 [Colwellia sp.]|nr:hypothetical protein [Colwellia sp.]
MSAEYIIIAFYGCFLIIFFLTALVALGGILKVGLFKKIDPANTKWLMAALLIEIAGAVVLTYQNLPKPDWDSTQPFQLTITYIDYTEDWKKSLKPIDRDCIDLYKEGYYPDACLTINSAFKKIMSIVGDEGGGELYLETTSGPLRKGKALYMFPGESVKLVMDVTGHKEIEGFIRLTFKQPKRYVINTEGVPVERPEFKFTVDFIPDKNNNNIFRGDLLHPSIKANGKGMKLADVILVKKGS